MFSIHELLFLRSTTGLLNTHYQRKICVLETSGISLDGDIVSLKKFSSMSPQDDEEEVDTEAAQVDEASRCLGGIVAAKIWQDTSLCEGLPLLDDRGGRRQSIGGYGGRYEHLRGMVFILVSEIDSRAFCTTEAQHALSLLAACPSVGLVATATHLNVGLLWSQELLARFRWLHAATSLFTPFPLLANSLVLGRSAGGDQGSASGVEFVLLSLSAAHKELLVTVCRMHLAQAEEEATRGVPYTDVLSACRKALVVRTQIEFVKLLRELTDHTMLSETTEGETKLIRVRLSLELTRSIAGVGG
jgi:hypothetical protein